MIKREIIAPEDDLKEYIEYFIYSEFEFSESFNYVMRPDGYTELLIQDRPFSEYKYNERGYIRADKYFVQGQIKRAILASHESGRRYLVKFKPWGAHYFLNMPMDLFTDKIIGLETVMGKAGRDMAERVIGEADVKNAVSILQNYIRGVISRNVTPQRMAEDENLIKTVKMIMDSRRITRVMELLDSSYYSNRHLRRKFSAMIGLSPKAFIKIIRLNLCLESIRKKKIVRQETLLKEYGYYDRSHMIREFKEILKLTPASYLNDYLRVMDVIREY